MTRNWTQSWKASRQPRKQHAFVAKAPLHVRSAMVGSHLSKELRQKHKTRSMRVRKGDKVKVQTGQFKGKSGAVESVDTRNAMVYITGIESVRKDGTKAMRPIHPSNLLITELAADKRRMAEHAQPKENKEKKQ